MVEVETFRNHLSTDKDISTLRTKVADDTLVGIASTSGVKVHTGNTRFGEGLAHLFFYLFCAVAACPEVGRATARTLSRHLIGETTVVTSKLVQLAVQCQFDIAMLACGHPAALLALYHRRETATVLKQYSLLATFQGFAHAC